VLVCMCVCVCVYVCVCCVCVCLWQSVSGRLSVSVSVSVSVSMSVSISVCAYVCVCVRACVCVHVHVHVHVHVFVRACVRRVCMCLCVFRFVLRACVHLPMKTFFQTHVHLYIYAHGHMLTCEQACTHICILQHPYIYTYLACIPAGTMHAYIRTDHHCRTAASTMLFFTHTPTHAQPHRALLLPCLWQHTRIYTPRRAALEDFLPFR